MQQKKILLCVEEPNYRLTGDLALLDTNCDVHSGINDYNCTVLNSTSSTHGLFNDGDDARDCRQLMVIECVRTVPMVSITTTEVNRRDDVGDNSDGDDDDGGGSDDGAAAGARAFGGNTDDDDDDDDDLVLGLQMQRTDDTNEPPCPIFINVSMKELGK